MAHLSYIQPVRAKAISSTSHQAVTGPAVFYGLDVNDDTSGNVHVHIYNGTSSSGVMVASAVPPNGDHDQHWLGPNGILCPNGIYVEVVSGTPSGSIFYK